MKCQTGIFRTKASGSLSRFRGKNLSRVLKGCGLGVLVIVLFFPLASAEEIKYDSAGQRNPFIPLVTSEGAMAITAVGVKKSSGLKVEGIIFDPKGGSFALINGKFYKEGEQVDNAQLISIFKDRVVLSVNDAEKIFWLREEIVGQK
ncbi:MAG: hypothetical protein EXS63_01945 [Candidatus Omnitrophica bacterium]|nr:hypothetical protein [Candidatus Omnitrophota bacterium]